MSKKSRINFYLLVREKGMAAITYFVLEEVRLLNFERFSTSDLIFREF